MYKLLLSAALLIAFLSGCVVPTYIGTSSLNETRVSKSEVKISNVLLVGAGSSASRLFLENLSIEIVHLFAQHNIPCDFTYVGKIPRHSHVNLRKVIAPKYDTYLVLNPKDTSYVDTHKQVALVSSGFANGSVIGNQYKEDYYTELYTNGDSLTKVWQGELNVDFDFATPNRYRKIAKGIFDQLAKNNLIAKN